MENWRKKHFYVPLLMLMLAAFVLLVTGSRTYAATLNHTKEEAIAWCKDKIGKPGVDYDNAFGVQCVDLIRMYSSWLGKDLGIAQGNGSAYNYGTQSINTFPVCRTIECRQAG